MANKRPTQPEKTPSAGGSAPFPAISRSDTSSSSKANLPQEQTKNQIDFQFLNFSHPSDAKASRARRTVRSHVTRQQHQREHAAQAARRAKSFQAQATEPEETQLPRRVHAQTFPSNAPVSSELPVMLITEQSSSPEASSGSTSPLTSSKASLDARVDISELYPEAWHPYVPRVMVGSRKVSSSVAFELTSHLKEHYLNDMAVDMPELDGVETKGLLRSRFFPFIMTDPAPLHAVMLMAATHFGNIRGSRSHAIDLLQLKGMAIREINNALEDPVRATSDQLIAAVAEMACYEALVGDRNIYNTHMTGLLRMVSLRGGLPSLGLEGLLERLLLWIDANAAHITSSHVYFDPAAFPSRAVHPQPDPERFFGGLPNRTQA